MIAIHSLIEKDKVLIALYLAKIVKNTCHPFLYSAKEYVTLLQKNFSLTTDTATVKEAFHLIDVEQDVVEVEEGFIEGEGI